MKTLILAAGYATRLYPLTKEYPKALLTIGERPIIDYIIDKLGGIEETGEIIVVTNSKFISKFRNWKHSHRTRRRITLVDDLTKDNASRRGAVGDMAFVIDKKDIDEDLLVIGGDNLFDGSLKEFLSFAKKYKGNPVIGAYDLGEKIKASRYGVIKLDKKNRLIDFQEKPKKPKSALVAMCLYYFPKEKLGIIREYLNNEDRKHDATGYYIDWLKDRYPVYGFVFTGRWYDIGDHKFYNEAKGKF